MLVAFCAHGLSSSCAWLFLSNYETFSIKGRGDDLRPKVMWFLPRVSDRRPRLGVAPHGPNPQHERFSGRPDSPPPPMASPSLSPSSRLETDFGEQRLPAQAPPLAFCLLTASRLVSSLTPENGLKKKKTLFSLLSLGRCSEPPSLP